MTPEELREKVRDVVSCPMFDEEIDAAIRVVLDAVQLKDCERIIREYSQHPEDLDFADQLRVLLPQDKQEDAA